jgi:hypothetical protein
MPLRDFTDDNGTRWEVWATYPASDKSAEKAESALTRFLANAPLDKGVAPGSVREMYREGWLTFSAGEDRRRLAPVPIDWEKADDAELRRHLTRARRISGTHRKL